MGDAETMDDTRSIASLLMRSSKAVKDGYAASLASIVSVFLLMWLRTTMSFQHVHGLSMAKSVSTLYADGGVPRFYRGIVPALIMMPLSRFGDIFSNEFAREFLSSSHSAAVVTAAASSMAALWRIGISPVDTVKTTLQVHGRDALPILRDKIGKMGVGALYQGALGSAAATWVGHYPWFVTYNFLEKYCVEHRILDAHLRTSKGLRRHLRRALVGIASSLVSDVCSNAIRVMKTYKQTSVDPIGYGEAAARIVSESGLEGLFFRGLSSKLFSNALNAMLFTVVWKALAERFAASSEPRREVEKHEKKKD